MAVADPPSCAVDVVRAPDVVRAAISGRLCPDRVALDIRVVPTDGGFYVIATDRNGTVRDATVATADEAAAQVERWEQELATQRARDAVTITDDPTPRGGGATSTGGALAGMADELDEHAAARAPDHARFRIHFGGTLGGHPSGGTIGSTWDGDSALGLRAALEYRLRRLGAHGTFSAGAALSLADTSYAVHEMYAANVDSQFRFRDTRAVACAALRWTQHGWFAGTSLGLGLIATNASVTSFQGNSSDLLVSPALEVASTVGRRLAAGWSAELGPVFTMFAQSRDTTSGMGGFTRTNTLEVYAGASRAW